jgi:hypothetical protein
MEVRRRCNLAEVPVRIQIAAGEVDMDEFWRLQVWSDSCFLGVTYERAREKVWRHLDARADALCRRPAQMVYVTEFTDNRLTLVDDEEEEEGEEAPPEAEIREDGGEHQALEHGTSSSSTLSSSDDDGMRRNNVRRPQSAAKIDTSSSNLEDIPNDDTIIIHDDDPEEDPSHEEEEPGQPPGIQHSFGSLPFETRILSQLDPHASPFQEILGEESPSSRRFHLINADLAENFEEGQGPFQFGWNSPFERHPRSVSQMDWDGEDYMERLMNDMRRHGADGSSMLLQYMRGSREDAANQVAQRDAMNALTERTRTLAIVPVLPQLHPGEQSIVVAVLATAIDVSLGDCDADDAEVAGDCSSATPFARGERRQECCFDQRDLRDIGVGLDQLDLWRRGFTSPEKASPFHEQGVEFSDILLLGIQSLTEKEKKML